MPNASFLAEIIADDFYNERLKLSERREQPACNWSDLPEVEAVKQLSAIGTTERTIRVFVTLISAMERARDSSQLWRAAVDLFKSYPEAFDPATVRALPAEKLSDLLRDSKVSRYHKDDFGAWCRISQSLMCGSGPVYKVIESGVGDAKELLRDLQSRNNKRQNRYPLLRGPKIGPMWVRIMANPGGANIARLNAVPVAVDKHVRRATENLRVTDTRGLTLRKAKPKIQQVWRRAISAGKIGGPLDIAETCAALDPALWFFGNYGCGHCEKAGRRIPISSACNACRLPA